MKNIILPLIALSLFGCAQPFSESSKISSSLKEQGVVSEPTLIKLEVSEVENPIVEALPVSPETVEITSSQTPDPVQVPSSVVDEVVSVVSPVVEQTVSQAPEQVQSTVSEVVQETVVAVKEVEQAVMEEVVYISEELKNQESPKEEVLSEVEEEAVMAKAEEVIEEKQETVVQLEEEMVKELESITYGDKTQDVTMVTYQKKEGKLESYSIYSQDDKAGSWVKEFTVFVENGKVQLIQSHNKNKIENFSQELEEIVSLERKFKEKIKTSEVDNSKEVSVAQFVKNKKDKKTSKIKNKKFGKKSKKKNRH